MTKRLCNHATACKYGETICSFADIAFVRHIWWCQTCGALGLKDDMGRPKNWITANENQGYITVPNITKKPVHTYKGKH